MSTTIRPEVSEKSPYYISRHRYYELKHFVMQLPEWVRYLKEFEGKYPNQSKVEARRTDIYGYDPTEIEVERREYYRERIKMVIECLEKSFDEIPNRDLDHVLEAVTTGLSYEDIRARYNVPMSKEYYYIRYRKFFWTLSQARK